MVHLSDLVASKNGSKIVFQEFDAGAKFLVTLLLVRGYVRSLLLGPLWSLDGHVVNFC